MNHLDQEEELADQDETTLTAARLEEVKQEAGERGHWSRDLEFFLSTVGFAVGLGNVWRFPYICMRNGGGAFLIPYLFFLLVAGIPLCFLEFALGQFSSESAITVFKLCPLFSGVGWTMVILVFISSTCYNMIIAWVLYYLGCTFKSWKPLWSSCDNDWNTKYCQQSDATARNISVITNISMTSLTQQYLSNGSTEYSNASSFSNSPVEEFWRYNILNLSNGIDDTGGLSWQLVLCLLVAWTIVFICNIKGYKSSGKVVYVTATSPYIFLIAITVRGLTLPGSLDGILFYIRPDWQKLLSFKIWCEACLQIIFSTGCGWGIMTTLASFNKFSYNCYRYAIAVTLLNAFTSFLAGFAVFSVIGYMAHQKHVPVNEAITSGPGLAFVVYPEALSTIPGAAIWSVLFFTMLLMLGIGSQLALVETVVCGIVDRFPDNLRHRKIFVLISVIVISITISLVYTAQAGMYWFQIIDYYGGSFGAIICAILECLIVGYIYGANRFYGDINRMLGKKPSILWKICWCFITPVSLFIFLVFAFVTAVAPTYGNYSYPPWAIGFGWTLAAITPLIIPLTCIKAIVTRKGSLFRRIRSACKPDPTWGPKPDQEITELHLLTVPGQKSQILSA